MNDTYPVFFDPTWDEIVRLASSRPDTLRIIDASSDNGTWGPLFAVASGYGYTHSTIVAMHRALGGHRYWRGDAIILHQDGPRRGEWYCNPDCLLSPKPQCNTKALPLHIAKQYLSPTMIAFWTDFISACQQLS